MNEDKQLLVFLTLQSRAHTLWIDFVYNILIGKLFTPKKILIPISKLNIFEQKFIII